LITKYLRYQCGVTQVTVTVRLCNSNKQRLFLTKLTVHHPLVIKVPNFRKIY